MKLVCCLEHRNKTKVNIYYCPSSLGEGQSTLDPHIWCAFKYLIQCNVFVPWLILLYYSLHFEPRYTKHDENIQCHCYSCSGVWALCSVCRQTTCTRFCSYHNTKHWTELCSTALQQSSSRSFTSWLIAVTSAAETTGRSSTMVTFPITFLGWPPC